MHISTVNDKSAKNLAIVKLDPDWYHQNIKKAARILVGQGNGDFVYGGQYPSGNSFWIDTRTQARVSVKVQEE